jgi:diguanylate cyclase (GGDEF)-like protein/PAS domain S-box-containing protein
VSLWLCTVPNDASAHRTAAWGARLLAAIVGALGLLTLGEYGFGWDPGIDQMLFDVAGPSLATPFPGRMALMTAVNFVLLATALLLIDIETRGARRPSNWLVLAIAANSFLAILGYLYDVDALYRVAALSSVALHTAILFVLVCIGVACARPGGTFVVKIMGASEAALINRRLLPAAILIPPAAGWLCWQGERAGFYSPAFGLALFAASNVAFFAALVWWSARALQRLHEQRNAVSQTSAMQQAILNSADFTVISTDPRGLIRSINAGVVNMLGYEPAELVGKLSPEVIHDRAEIVARAQALSRELGRTVEPGFDALVAKARRVGSDENDWTYVRKDGSRFPVRLSVTPLTDDAGNLSGFLGIGKDISAQKIAEEALRDSEQRMRLIADNMPAIVAYVDREERYRFANSMLAQQVGVDTGQLLGRTIREVRGEAIYATIAEQVARALRGEHVSFEGPGPETDGEHFYRSVYVPDVGPDGGVRGFYAMIFDITDLKASKMRLADSEARLRLITDNLPVYISYIDRERRFRFNNAPYARFLGRPLEQITGERVEDVAAGQSYEQIRPSLDEAFTGVPVSFEFALPTSSRAYGGTYIPDINAANEVVGVYGLINDITEQKDVENTLRQLAQFDSLTGLANRSCFDDKLGEAIARSERSGTLLALVFLDLDDFKSINDTFGHQGGDLALQEFARRLTHSVRSTDTVARLAGDEFVVIIELLKHAEEATVVAAKIVAAMAAPFRIFDEHHVFSTSMGIAVRRRGETEGDALLRRADTALYRAKASGRGRFVVEE